MNTITINTREKRTYTLPQIVCVRLDNEISLQLESPGTPGNGDEVYNVPNHFKTNPFKDTLA